MPCVPCRDAVGIIRGALWKHDALKKQPDMRLDPHVRPDHNPKEARIMAATTPIMPGTCRAVSSYSRRELISGSLLAVLSGAAFAAAVLAPDYDGPAMTDMRPPADAVLVELCVACDVLQQQADALWQGATRIADDDARDIALMRIADRQVPFLKRLCELRPTTPRGHAMRARTLLLWDKDPCWTRPACMDEALAAAVVRDLAKSA